MYGPVILRAGDHDAVLADHRHFSFAQSSSASRFIAGCVTAGHPARFHQRGV
jgi:hypothetical protein